MGERDLPKFICAPQKLLQYLEKNPSCFIQVLEFTSYQRIPEDLTSKYRRNHAIYTHTFLHIHSSTPGTMHCKEASAEPWRPEVGSWLQKKGSQICSLPQQSSGSLHKFSPLPAHSACLWDCSQANQGGEARGEQLPSTPTLALGSLGKACLSLL